MKSRFAAASAANAQYLALLESSPCRVFVPPTVQLSAAVALDAADVADPAAAVALFPALVSDVLA